MPIGKKAKRPRAFAGGVFRFRHGGRSFANHFGGVTAFGLPDGLPLYVDARVLELDWVILGTGGRNGKIRMAPDVFRRMSGAKVVEGLAVPQRS